MTKYFVCVDTHNEERKGSTDWSVQDMLDAYWRKGDRRELKLGEYDTEEEARERFNEEKKYCDSRYQKGQIGWLVLFDWLSIQEAEVDEDGEYLWADIIDEYVAPIGG